MKNNTVSYVRLGKTLGLTFLYSFFIVILVINVSPFMDGQIALMDFGSFYASGIKSRNGENPYDPNSAYIFEIHFSQIGAGGKMINLNPPVSVIIFEYISRFNPYHSIIVWQIISALLYTSLVFLLTLIYRQNITPTRFIWAFSLAGFWHTLGLGQVYVFLLAFAVLGWVCLQRGKYILAGAAIGLVVAIKPNFIIWPIFLLVSGYYVSFIMSALSSITLSLIPIILYGTKIYGQWLEASTLPYATLIMPGNNSILGLTSRFQNIYLGIALSIALVLILLILSKREPLYNMQQAEHTSALGIIASILASPISWSGYTILILPLFFSVKKWSLLVTISALILSIPFAIVLQLHQTSFINFVVFGWLYGWGILLLVGDVVRNAMTTKNIQTS